MTDAARGASPSRLGVLDAVLAAGAVLLGLIAVAMQFVLVPRFAAMFADFGGPLPDATELALQSWFGPAVALDTLTFAAAGVVIRLKQPHGPGRVLLGVAIIQAAAACVFLLYALYAPMFELAGAIR